MLSDETKNFYLAQPEVEGEPDPPDGDGATVPAPETVVGMKGSKKKTKKKKGRKKETEMQHIFGDIKVNDYYPGMKNNQHPSNVQYLPGFDPNKKEY